MAEDYCLAIKDENGLYYCGMKYWDKQLRKAKLYHKYAMAEEAINYNGFGQRYARIIEVQIKEI